MSVFNGLKMKVKYQEKTKEHDNSSFINNLGGFQGEVCTHLNEIVYSLKRLF
jgi:hypothetical protein